jgi:hypothetical protein
MKTTKFLSAVLAIAASLSMASAVVAGIITPTPILNAYYDPATGNIKLQNTTSGSQSFQSFDVLTIGNGSYGPVSGRPDNVGFLSTGTANLPVGTPNPVQPTSPFGLNGLYSEVAALATGAPVMTLSPYAGWSETPGNQIGPVGSYWDLGNIAITGMSQADLDARFLSPSDLTPSGLDEFGTFLFSYQTGPTTFSVTIPGGVIAVAPIPEPSTIALAAVAATIGGVGAVSKRRKKALAAKRLSTNA